MKYHIFRKSEYTGRVEVLSTKCSDVWASEVYLERHPDRVWKFSKSGAKKIISRYEGYGWHYKYWMTPIAEVAQ